MVDLTLHFPILSGGRDDFAMLNRNASAANPIQIRPATFPPKSGVCECVCVCVQASDANYLCVCLGAYSMYWWSCIGVYVVVHMYWCACILVCIVCIGAHILVRMCCLRMYWGVCNDAYVLVHMYWCADGGRLATDQCCAHVTWGGRNNGGRRGRRGGRGRRSLGRFVGKDCSAVERMSV